MAMSNSRLARSLLSLRRPAVERLNCRFMEDRSRAHFSSHIGQGELPEWRKLDSRKCGIDRSKLPVASWIVLKNLHHKGFEAYLVGGCVRDLLLNKVPKDFDVITTAGLKQVKKIFRRSIIFGKRFPICRVTIKDSALEVSSFHTLAKESRGEKVNISQMPKGCDPCDFRRWENCMHRDFTVNSLFFDPFLNVIYDYTNAMMDLKSLKLRTVKPAHSSFEEDQARILRGLRLAARLNLSFSKETEDALHSLSSSIADLSMSRIFMEMNYMFSYGASERSLLMLKRFQLLDILLPFHAAYLSKQVVQNQVHSLMLMKLFFNLDQLITCDRPCGESLWVAILAFHLAIFSNPQHPVVVLTIASLLCNKTLEESINFARENGPVATVYIPEIISVLDNLSDDEIIERVTQFVGQVRKSVDGLINKNCLLELMSRFPEFPCSGLVFIPQKMGQKVKSVFDILPNGSVSSGKANERNQQIQHRLPTEGNVNEVRFMLGTIMTKTLLHSKNLAQGAVAEARKDDLQVVNPPQVTNLQQKLNVDQQICDTSNRLRMIFTAQKNGKKRSTETANHKEFSGSATKKTRLSKDNTTAVSRLSKIMKD